MSSNKCPRCKKSVYLAEEVLGAGAHWHRMCFQCIICKKGLDSTTVADKDGEIYCRNCYGKSFGIKGYGYGGGAGILSTEAIKENKEVAAVLQAPKGVFCGECGASDQTGKFCGGCGATIVQVTAAVAVVAQVDPAATQDAGTGGTLSSPNSSTRSTSPMTNSAPKLNTTPRSSLFGGGEICPRCSKTVYHAEKAIGAGRSWHRKTCFVCRDCKKGLDSDTLADKDGEIFCRACYGKNFGPKGYGYGGGAGALKNTQ